MLEKNKTRWISRNKLIKLLNDYELNENIISIEVINSKKLSGIKELDSFGNINHVCITSREIKRLTLAVGRRSQPKIKNYVKN